MAALARDRRRHHDHGARRLGLAARLVHLPLPALHGRRRLLGRKHGDAGARRHFDPAIGLHRPVPGIVGRALRPRAAGPGTGPGCHADGADLRLPDAADPAARLRACRRPDRQRDLRHPADGPQRDGQCRRSAHQYRGIRRYGRLYAAAVDLVGAGSRRHAGYHARAQSMRDGGAQHGDHRLHHRRLRRHRLGGAVDAAQGGDRSQPAGWKS